MKILPKIFILLTTLCVNGSLFSYTHEFRNGTPFSVKVRAKYKSGLCRDDDFYLPAGGRQENSVGACQLTKVEATVEEKEGRQVQSPKNVEAVPYDSTYTGSATFLITGRYNDAPNYIVTRSVQ